MTGRYAIQTVYGNHFDEVNTGITVCVKTIEVVDSTHPVAAFGVVMMPHLRDWDEWRDSSFIQVSLRAGVRYKIRIKDFYNMSYLARNAMYSQYPYRQAGGADRPVNRANISSLKILRME